MDNRDDTRGCYGVIAEYRGQAPILMEAEGGTTSYEGAVARAQGLRDAIRYQIVRLVPVGSGYQNGNELLLKDLERMQS